jgi:hypothetical protein
LSLRQEAGVKDTGFTDRRNSKGREEVMRYRSLREDGNVRAPVPLGAVTVFVGAQKNARKKERG